MSTRRRTDAEYAELQADIEAGAWLPVSEPVAGTGAQVVLKGGRPAGRKLPSGNTPTTSVRLPVDIKARLNDRAAAEDVKPAEIIRRALVEYLDRHPA